MSDDSNYNGLDGDDVELTNRDDEKGRKGRGFGGGNDGGAAGSSGTGDSGGKDSAPGKIKKSITASKIADFGSSLRGFLSALTGIDQESGSTAKDHAVADIGEDGLRGSVHQAVELLFEERHDNHERTAWSRDNDATAEDQDREDARRLKLVAAMLEKR